MFRRDSFSALLTKAIYGAFGFQQLLVGIQVAASEDAGESWTLNSVLTVDDDAHLPGADRQWLAFGPAGIVYVSFQHAEGLGILVARSDDGGHTFGPFVSASGPPYHAHPARFRRCGGRDARPRDGTRVQRRLHALRARDPARRTRRGRPRGRRIRGRAHRDRSIWRTPI